MSLQQSSKPTPFELLASNQDMHALFYDYFSGKLSEAQVELNNLAVAALMQPTMVPHAQMQLGRHKALSDILFELKSTKERKQ